MSPLAVTGFMDPFPLEDKPVPATQREEKLREEVRGWGGGVREGGREEGRKSQFRRRGHIMGFF